MASFLKNDLIFVQTGAKPGDNDFVIAKLPIHDEVVFRRHIKVGQEILLKPLNSAYPTLHMTPEIEIVGVVFMRYTQL